MPKWVCDRACLRHAQTHPEDIPTAPWTLQKPLEINARGAPASQSATPTGKNKDSAPRRLGTDVTISEVDEDVGNELLVSANAERKQLREDVDSLRVEVDGIDVERLRDENKRLRN